VALLFCGLIYKFIKLGNSNLLQVIGSIFSMIYEPYTLHISEYDTRFSFQSIGKKGTVEKVIYFSPNEEGMFNLGLVDVDPITGTESDESITNNGDLPAVMATVVTAMLLFLETYPDDMIYFKGNCEGREKLYQIQTNIFYPALQEKLTVLGEVNCYWYDFEANIPFENFIVARKELNLKYKMQKRK
jgi:hypothetical protein